MGGIKAVIFDCSSTVADYGCGAPVEAFAVRGVTIRNGEARGPLGLGKRHHVEARACLPRIAAAWHDVHGQDIMAADISRLRTRPIAPLHEAGVPHAIDTVTGLPRTINNITQSRVASCTRLDDRESGR